MLLSCAQNAGNLLLNIGPYADGTVPEPSVRILEEAGQWLKRSWECVTGSERHPFSWGAPAPVTARGNKVYLHFRQGPGKTLCWAESRSKVLSAKLMYDKSDLEFEQKDNRLFIYRLPDPLPDPVMNSIVLEYASKPESVPADRTF
jgi:alpha-L-fucosidase